MKVLVTGGTGFVGAHTVAELARNGHQVRLLVRDRTRIARALDPLGVDPQQIEVAEGDITDASAVERAMDGADAVIHGAALFSYDVRVARKMRETNAPGTEIVIGTAARLGLNPIIHVSSTVALLSADAPTLSSDSPPGAPAGAYAQSKAESERVARRYQDGGAPVTITNPGFVLGPDDPNFGESAQITTNVLNGTMSMAPDLGTYFVDARDVARLHAAIVERKAVGRYIAPGHYASRQQMIDTLNEVTGRNIKVRQIPTPMALATGRMMDACQRILPFRLPLSHDVMWIATRKMNADDTPARTQFGLEPIPFRDSMADTVRWLLETGHITPKQAGKAAEIAAV